MSCMLAASSEWRNIYILIRTPCGPWWCWIDYKDNFYLLSLPPLVVTKCACCIIGKNQEFIFYKFDQQPTKVLGHWTIYI